MDDLLKEASKSMVCSRRVKIKYRNYKGIVSERYVVPLKFWFGANEWHPEPQWIMTAFDDTKQAFRDFAMTGILSWEESFKPFEVQDEPCENQDETT